MGVFTDVTSSETRIKLELEYLVKEKNVKSVTAFHNLNQPYIFLFCILIMILSHFAVRECLVGATAPPKSSLESTPTLKLDTKWKNRKM